MTSSALLARTPSPVKGESPWGYLLRVAEANGYETPHSFFPSKVQQTTVGRSYLELALLSNILGQDKRTLRAASYHLNGLRVSMHGHAMAAPYLRPSRPQICPICLSSSDIIPAVWDLKWFTGCHHHRLHLMDKCYGCGNALSVHRPGPTICRCGADLTRAPQLPITDEGTLVALAMLDAAYSRTPAVSPFEAIEGMVAASPHTCSPGTITRLIIAFARLSTNTTLPPFRAVAAAGAVFANWPSSYHDILDRTRGRNRSFKNPTEFSKAHVTSYLRLVSRPFSEPDETQFIRDEFYKYSQRFSATWFARKSAGSSVMNYPRWMGVKQIDKSFGVHRRALSKLIKQYDISTRTAKIPSGHRLLVDTRDPSFQVIKDYSKKRFVSIIEAALTLGLTRAVIERLRDKRLFDLHPIKRARSVGIPESAILLLRNQILNLPINEDDQWLMPSVGFVPFFRSKGNYTLDMKIDAFIKIMKHEIPLRATGPTINDIRIDHKSLKDLRIAHSEPTPWMSANAAAKSIGCATYFVPDLIRRKFLSDHSLGRTAKIPNHDVENFAKKFTACSLIAKEFAIQSQSVIAMCKSMTVELLVLRTKPDNGCRKSFVHRHDVARVRAALMTNEQCASQRHVLNLGPS